MRWWVSFGLLGLVILAGIALVQPRLREAARAHLAAWRYRQYLDGAPPERRVEVLQRLGRRQHGAFRRLLETYANGAPTRPETQTAQLLLIKHHPGSWPRDAAEEYERILRRSGLETWMGSRWTWWMSAPAWDPSAADYEPPGRSADWERLLARWPRFISADDAAWHLARAYHVENRPADVIRALDRALRIGDGSAHDVIVTSLRQYTFAICPARDLDLLAHDTALGPEVRRAVDEARGWRRIAALDFTGALAIWRATPPERPVDFAMDAWTERIAILDALVPLERAWRAAPSEAERERTFVALAEATLTRVQDLASLAACPYGVAFLGAPENLVATTALPVPEEALLEGLDRVAQRGGEPARRAAFLAATIDHFRISGPCCGDDVDVLVHRSAAAEGDREMRDGAERVRSRYRRLAETDARDPATAAAAFYAALLAADPWPELRRVARVHQGPWAAEARGLAALAPTPSWRTPYRPAPEPWELVCRYTPAPPYPGAPPPHPEGDSVYQLGLFETGDGTPTISAPPPGS